MHSANKKPVAGAQRPYLDIPIKVVPKITDVLVTLKTKLAERSLI